MGSVQSYITEDIKTILSEPQIIADECNTLKKLIRDIYQDNQLLFKLTPGEFEKLIAELLRLENYDVELTKQTRDGGYDIIAVKKEGFPLKMLVECKRYTKQRIGVEIVRSFMHVIKENANQGLLVTTLYLTLDAKREIRQPYMLLYKEQQGVIDWINKHATTTQ